MAIVLSVINNVLEIGGNNTFDLSLLNHQRDDEFAVGVVVPENLNNPIKMIPQTHG
ncbi:hypothetical protein BE221DRAFT_65038 [Ostreococcus tauri]|uniref:Uncharacterized protein n=1 Tax=Ostreococcus tauri TaxID=70448 RepID=A0A1Y5HWK4_OSTTA|nr:hypothetical protein BE221DRAFT_65038 [Ostreococcus tauri]